MKGSKILPAVLLPGALALALSSTALAQDPVLVAEPGTPLQLGAPFSFVVAGSPGDLTFVAFNDHLAPFQTKWGTLDIVPDPALTWFLGPMNGQGKVAFGCNAPACDFSLAQSVFYGQALTFSRMKPAKLRGISEVMPLEFVAGEACAPCALDAATEDDVWAYSPHSEAFWLPGCPDARYSWVSPGTYTEDADGTAHLTGTIRQNDDADKRFGVDVFFSGRESISSNSGVFPPPLSPKLSGVLESALVENGGPIDASEWHYYTQASGTLTGAEDWAGVNYAIELRGPAAQVGYGGSLKNAQYGLSCWITLTRTSGKDCARTIHGDINIVIGACPEELP